MAKGVTLSGQEYEVINVMADGRVLDDMDGVVVPLNEKTMASYQFLLNRMLMRLDTKNSPEEVSTA